MNPLIKTIIQWRSQIIWISILICFFSINFFGDEFFIPQVYYFIAFTISIAILILIIYLFLRNQHLFNIKITLIDIVFISIIIYYLINTILISKFPFSHLCYKQLFSIITFYFVIKIITTRNKIDNAIIGVIIIFGLIECILSLKNIASFIPSQKMAFKLAGTFENPGLLGNYIAAIFPLAVSNLLQTSINKSNIIKFLSVLFVILGFITLIFLLARAAWIATIIGIIIVFEYKFHFSTIFLKNKLCYKITTIITALIFIIVTGIGMYKLNPESVDGRMLIYDIAIQDSKNHFIFGNGIETFSKNYNLAQIDYFKNGHGTEQQIDSAASVNTCFNEYINILYEAGIVGLSGFIAIIVIILLNYKRFTNHFENACFASLLSILVTALFSYPFHNIPTTILIIIFLCVLSRKLNYKTFRINKIVLVFTFCILLFIGYFTAKQIRSLNQWKELFNNKGHHTYSNIYPSLSSNKYFLYNYGLTLINNNELDESLKIMNELTNYYIDDAVLTAIASIYSMQNDLGNAEKYYLLAYYVSPSKIYSLSRLVDIYYNQGKFDKAEMLGKYVLAKKTKINSAEVMRIKEDIESIIN